VDAKREPDLSLLDALGELYERGFHTYLRVAEAIVGDPESAYDVVQEAFVRVIRGRSAYRGTGSLEGWVWRTLVNTAKTARRGAHVHLPLDELGDGHPSRNGDGADPGLQAAVAALPERQRLVLFLRYYADLDYRGIADALEIRPGTVSATLSQAHASLKRVLEEVPR
jgi:DNA-directed RNA polymerase specialized sigma24 family protein